MADIVSIFKSKYKDYQDTLKKTSYDKNSNVYLCQDKSVTIYNFDKIAKDMYPKKQPASYDALLFFDNTVYCIEFKNQKYSDIDRKQLKIKIKNSKDVLDEICKTNNINKKDYRFVFCVVYKNSETRWRRGIEKNTIQFELESYIPKYYDNIKTNDIQFFTNQFNKKYKKKIMKSF